MTGMMKKNITCPKCRRSKEVTLWNSINAELNPAEKQKLLDGTLFKFTCDCGYATEIAVPLIYHDEEHKAVVHYVWEEEKEEAEKEIRELPANQLFTDLGYKTRIVTTHHRLREKVLIFDAGLDDRVIEIMKVYSFVQLAKQDPWADFEDVLFYKKKGKSYLEFIGKKNYTCEVQKGNYQKIRAAFTERLNQTAGDELCIDFQWAAEWLKKNGRMMKKIK